MNNVTFPENYIMLFCLLVPTFVLKELIRN